MMMHEPAFDRMLRIPHIIEEIFLQFLPDWSDDGPACLWSRPRPTYKGATPNVGATGARLQKLLATRFGHPVEEP